MMLARTRSAFTPPGSAVAGSTSVSLLRNQPLRSRLTVSFAGVPAVTTTGGLNRSSCSTFSSLVYVKAAPSNVPFTRTRSEEHTSELQSQSNLVCRLLLEKKERGFDTPAG